MQQKAVSVYRWVERMNRADQDAPEYFEAGSDLLGADEVPQSLLRVLKIIAEDFVPETRAAAATINQWLADNQPESGTAAERMLGTCDFTVRGQTLSSVAQTYRFYLLQRVHDTYEALQENDKLAVEDMLRSCGFQEILNIRLNRKLGRADNLEVWL